MTETTETLAETLEHLMAEGIIEKRGDRYRITPKGRALSDIQTSPDILPDAGRDYGNA